MPNYTFGTNGTVTTPDGRVIPYPAAPPADYRFGTLPLTPGQQAGPPGSNPLAIAGNSASLFPNTVPPDMPLWPMSSFPAPTQPQWPWNNPQGLNPPPNPPPNPNPNPNPAANNPPPAQPQPAARPSPIHPWFQQFAQNAMPNNPPPAQPPAPPQPPNPTPSTTWPDGTPRNSPVVGQTMNNGNGLTYTWDGSDWRPSQQDWSQYVQDNPLQFPQSQPKSSTAPGFFGGIQQAASNVINPIATTIGQAMDSSGPRMRQFGGTRSLNRQLTNHLASR